MDEASVLHQLGSDEDGVSVLHQRDREKCGYRLGVIGRSLIQSGRGLFLFLIIPAMRTISWHDAN